MQSKKRIGEKEFSGKQLKQLEQAENYIKKAVEYSKGKYWGIGDVPKEFGSIISIDIFFEILLQAGSDNPQGVLGLLSVMKRTIKADIKNPLKRDNKELNEYFFAKLKEAEKLFSLAPPRESELKKASPPQPIDKEQNRTKQLIAEAFESMDTKGWRYAFSKQHEYNLFADLLTNFFEHKDCSIPETPIQLKRTCKTKVAKTLGGIHAELSEKPLSSDIEYFKIIKVLNHFKEVSNSDLVKAMQR